MGNGVFQGGNFLKVSVYDSMDIQVAPGKAYINGYYYVNRDAPITLSLQPSNLTKPRIDTVVLCLDLNNSVRSVSVKIKTGVFHNSPQAPVLERNTAVWELGLAHIRVNPGVTQILQSNITDLRLNSSYCGIVAALITQPDLTDIFNQYKSKYDQVETSWSSFTNVTQNQWDVFDADFRGWFNQIKAELFSTVSTDFDDWSRRPGYKKVTVFNSSDGSITETIQNCLNSSVLAVKTTRFPSADTIIESLSFTQPVLYITKTTVFSNNTITEAYE